MPLSKKLVITASASIRSCEVSFEMVKAGLDKLLEYDVGWPDVVNREGLVTAIFCAMWEARSTDDGFDDDPDYEYYIDASF